MSGTNIDKEAREKIERLERRLEGAHLTPGLKQIFKQPLQGVLSWTGWEVFGIGFFILLGIFLIALMVFGFDGGCTARRTEYENERYGPACQALGLTFTTLQNGGVLSALEMAGL